jgi:TRAP-type C4-dicarboxylate transport system substrate-binding protein
MKGLRLRVVNDPIQIGMLKNLGAIPVPLDPTEVFTALQNHTVDGVVNAPGPAYSLQWTSLTKYQSVVNTSIFVSVVAINKSLYESMPKSLQQLLMRLAQAMSTREQAYQAEGAQTVDKAIIAQGNTVNTVSPSAMQAFKSAVAPVYQEAASKYPASFIAELQAGR